MFDYTSRYASLPTRVYQAPDGREIAYKARRLVPPAESLPLFVLVTVEQSDRLDLVAARTLGQPELFWQICDANEAMNPFDLTAQPGRKLRVGLPQS